MRAAMMRWMEGTTKMQREPMFNVRTRKVGGLRFVRIGRFVFSFCVRREA